MGLSKHKRETSKIPHSTKKGGKETHDTTQAIQRWTQWIQEHSAQAENENQNIQIDHIKEQTWGEMEEKLNKTQKKEIKNIP